MSAHQSLASNNLQSHQLCIDVRASAAFGEFLRLAREQRGITLEQICQETKIPRRHLEALEHGQLAAVPGRTYRRGEVVAYAKVVGLDRSVALDRLEQASATLERHAPELPPPSGRVWSRTPLFTVLVLLTAGGLVGSTVWNRLGRPAPNPAGATGGADQLPPAASVTEPIESPRVDADRPPRAAIESSSSGSAESTLGGEASALPARLALTATSAESGLVIVSDPPGARITVDGVGWGVTPLTIRNLPPGLKQIRLTKSGYTAATRAVRLVDGKTTNVDILLQPGGPTPPD